MLRCTSDVFEMEVLVDVMELVKDASRAGKVWVAPSGPLDQAST